MKQTLLPLLLVLAVAWGQEGKSHVLQIIGETDFKDMTLTLVGSDLIFVPDAKGFLQDPLNQNRQEVTLTNGRYTLEFFRGSQKKQATFSVTEATPRLIQITTSGARTSEPDRQKRLEAVTVSGFDARKEYARSVITADDARMIPGAGGDVVRSVANQPGVVKTTGYASGMFIRGGELEDLTYSYDAIRVGNPFHVVGVNSAFPALSIESLNFYSGVPPLRFGTSLAAIEVLSKTRYDKKSAKAEFDVNLAAAGFYLSLPVSPAVQISLGARRTYYEAYYSILKGIDTVRSLGGGLLTTFSTVPFFYDLNAKIDINVDRRNSLSLVFIQSMDQALFDTGLFPRTNALGSNLTLSGDKLGFENTWNATGFVWSHDSEKLRNKLTVSRYYNSNSFADFEQAIGLPTLPGSVESYALADTAFYRPGDSVALELGGEVSYESFPFTLRSYKPNTAVGLLENLANMSADTNVRTSTPSRLRASAFLGGEFATGILLWNAGLRANWNHVSMAFDLDPRVGVAVQPNKDTAIYLRGGKFSSLPLLYQIAPIFSNTGLLSPYTWQGVLGAQWKIRSTDFKVEGYGISFQNQILPTLTGPASFTNAGDGTSFGAEIFIKQNLTPTGLMGWFSYAFNKSDRTTLEPSNRLVSSTFRREVPHSVSLILAQVIPIRPKSKLILGTRFFVAAGRPYTGQSIQSNGTGLVFVEDTLKNAERLPTRFTWDLKIEWDFPMFANGEGSLYLDFWNVEGLFGIRNATYANYDAGMVNPNNPILYNPNLKAGQRAPVQYIYDLPPMPILGFKLTF